MTNTFVIIGPLSRAGIDVGSVGVAVVCLAAVVVVAADDRAAGWALNANVVGSAKS